MKAMKRLVTLLLMIFMIVMPFGPDVVYTGSSEILYEFINDVNAQRKATVMSAWKQSDREILYSYFSEYELPDLDWNSLTQRSKASNFSYEEAIGDVDVLFKLLRSSYGGYSYFGGDATFIPAREQILTRINMLKNVSVKKLEDILQEELALLIRDKHFFVASPLWKMKYNNFWYYVPNLYFELNDISEEYWPYIKPTISERGSLCYGFSFFGAGTEDLPTEAIIDGEEHSLNWIQEKARTHQKDTAFSIERKCGVPILKLYTLTADTTTQRQLEQFPASAEQFTEYPVFIIDLRGNYGGSTTYASRWLENYLQKDISIKVITAQRCSPLVLNLIKNAANSDELKNVSDTMEKSLGAWISRTSEASYIDNKNLIFVLVDQNTGSAAEEFVCELRTLSNVIFVGMNTAGVNLCGNVCTTFLPKSGIKVRFGSSIAFYESTQNTEVVGIEPDLWVSSNRAEEAVLQLCQYYNIREEWILTPPRN